MTNYLVMLLDAKNSNKVCNGSLISRVVQKHGTKILYTLHVTGFDMLLDDEKK